MSFSKRLDSDAVYIDLLAFMQVVDPKKVKVGEREGAEEEAKLLDSTGDSAVGGGQEAETGVVTGVRIITDKAVVAEKPKRSRKKRQAVTDASGSSHPKKLRGDHITSIGAATGGKSPSVLKELLESSMLNVEAGVAAVATLPLVTSSVSTTPEHESGALTDSITGLNLCTIGASERSAVVPPVMTEVMVTSSAINASSIPKMISKMDYHHLFMEFNVRTARQACLNVKVRMRTKYCLSERKRLKSECEKQADLLKARDEEVENLKAQRLLKETEATEAARLRVQISGAEAMEKMHADEIDALKQKNVALESEKESLDGKVVELQSLVFTKDLELKDLNVVVSSLRSQKDSLVDQVHALETTCSGLRDRVSGYERLKEQIEEFQDAQMNIVNDRVAKLDADPLEMALHLEEIFYPHLLTTIYSQSRAIEKGKQDGLSAGINHGKADATTADVMNLLRLEGPLVDAPGMSDLQPDVEQLTLPIHRPEDQVVLGETSLSFALSVTHSQVERIRGNVAAQRVPAAIVTTTALSTTFAAASSVPPITVEDYEIVRTDGPEDAQGNGQGNVASFLTIEFEKEELDTTPERDPPS
ncbi:hypothetical protein Tco_0476156 [Tanacetum coccineum]